MTTRGVTGLITLSLTLGAGTVIAGTSERYVWRNIAINGGGFVTGVEFHPQGRGLAYARTDVGGAYRWDVPAARWVPLLDGLGQADWNLQGVESLALDPGDPDRVYLACGTYTQPLPEVSNGAILRSADRGATWQRAALPFKLGANEAGRGSGERLVVDPNQPNRLYFGTRRDGLWHSDDRGVTWSRLAGFPDIADESVKHPLKPGERYNHLSQAVGVVWVRIPAESGRPGALSPVVYAAISRRGDSVFRSTDGGETWSAIDGQPGSLRPVGAALAPNGALYVTYADEPGPNRMTAGAVWKFSPGSKTWTEITPEDPAKATRGFGYAGIGVDRGAPDTLVVSTWNRLPADEIYRSRDGGRSWQPLLAGGTWDHSSAPYTETMTHHWLSDLEIDPSDRNRLVFNTGYGLWVLSNAAAVGEGVAAHLTFFNRGLEETVPLALLSPPAGAHLLSGIGDIDGFVHDDFDVSPRQGRYSAPGYKNTEWLDYAALEPGTIVRSGTTYHDDRIHAAISEDGGRSWTALPNEPPHPGGGRRHVIGPVAISSDGKTIVWTPREAPPYFSDDRGNAWREAGLAPNSRVVGDRVEPATFYAYDSSAGGLAVSVDHGRRFETMQRGLAIPPPRPWNPPFGDLAAVPGRAGELWLAAGGRLYQFTDHGRRRVDFPDFDGVAGVGFGRAAPGAGHPTVFVAGSMAGVDGIHRSDDGGSSWICVTDSAHRFGSLGLLTGDPRVFGRVYACTSGRGIVWGELTGDPGISDTLKSQD